MMPPPPVDIDSILNSLIDINTEGAVLFRAAADTVERESLQVLFRHLVKQRLAFAEELQRLSACLCTG